MLNLGLVVECICIVGKRWVAHSFGNGERSEYVDEHKHAKLETIAAATEHILVEEEVGAGENHERLHVDEGWVRRCLLQSRLRYLHFFLLYLIFLLYYL